MHCIHALYFPVLMHCILLVIQNPFTVFSLVIWHQMDEIVQDIFLVGKMDIGQDFKCPTEIISKCEEGPQRI